MRLVGFPRPVNPRRGLAAVAVEQDWPVLRISPTGRVSSATGVVY